MEFAKIKFALIVLFGVIISIICYTFKLYKPITCLELFLGFPNISCQNDGPIVEISDGQLRGTINQTVGENRTYYAFRGIPYAKPPIGPLRFSNPVKNDKWNGVLNATTESALCVQSTGSLVTMQDLVIIGSEDCLYLNVYTTSLSNQSNLPVVVWIYGGAFTDGSGNYIDGGPDYILEKNIVFVSFNYRLGVFGFLSTADMAAPGNWGLKDQLLALNWVQDNIVQFGGDPKKVTIFGESAGAVSVAYLVQAKDKTKGLFRGAIMNSGNSLCPLALTRIAREIAFIIGLNVGIAETDTTKLVDKLRKVDAYQLRLAQVVVKDLATVALNALAGFPVGPVQEPDHADAIFSARSYQQLLNGDFNHVPLLIGYNSLEAAYIYSKGSFLIALLMIAYTLSPTRLSPYDLTNDITQMVNASKEVKLKYFGLKPLGLDEDGLAKFLTVDQFVRPTRKYVQLTSNYTNVYLYQFSYKGHFSQANISDIGAAHGEELSYLFRRYTTATPEDALTRERMVTMWANFIKELNPTPFPSDLLQNVTWIPNTFKTDTVNHVQYLNIDKSLAMIENPYHDDLRFYEDLYAKYGDPSWHTTY